jgi:hypothetical protein
MNLSLNTLPLFIVSALMAFAPSNGVAADNPESERSEILIGDIFIPQTGYDDNDPVQFTLAGYFQNSCYQLADTVVDKDANVFTVHQFASHPPSTCANPRIAAFSKDITLGVLPAGQYRSIFDLDPSPGLPIREADFSVSAARTQNVDDYSYAPVGEIAIPDVVNGIGNIPVTLSGIFNSSCQELKEVRVLPEDYTLVVLPILGTKHGVACVPQLSRFTHTLTLGHLSEGRYLLHVRTPNGGAINRVFSVITPDPS